MLENPKRFKKGDLVRWGVLHSVVSDVEFRYPRDIFGNGNWVEQEWVQILTDAGHQWIFAGDVTACNSESAVV